MRKNPFNVLIVEKCLNQKVDLKIDWATHEAAKASVLRWHYSKCLPTGKTVKVGVWEDNIFTGVVIFSYGANNNSAKYFGLNQQQVCELTRVALNKHKTPVSRILSIAIKFLRKQSPGIKVCFSYADKTNQNHTGIIYQANGWLYLGERKKSDKGAYYVINGKRIHGRSARAKYGRESNFPKGWTHVPSQTKHLYVKIFDPTYKLVHTVKDYPKCASSKDSVVTANHAVEGGAIPTDALQSSELING